MKINIKPPKISTSFKTEKIYPKLEELRVTPSVEEQNYKGAYGEIIIRGVTANIDEDIKTENIKAGVNILGVDGGYEGIDTSDATATPNDILQGKTAYSNNEKIEGTIQKYDGSYSGNVSEGIKITDASYLFYRGARIDYAKEIIKLCENVESATNMYYEATNLITLDLSGFNTSNVTDMSYMFYKCKNLITLILSGLDTSNVTNMNYMFSNCSKLTVLDLSNFNTENVINMSKMFYNCTNLITLDLSGFDTSNVTDMNYMFANCENLTNLDLSSFDMSNVTNVSAMFTYCENLTDLDLSSFDMSNVINVDLMFNYCISLENLKSFKNLGKGYTQKTNNYSKYKLNLYPSRLKITVESLIDVLTNGLYDLNLTYDVANGGTLYRQSCELGTENLAKLQATEEGLQAIADAQAKGWDVT